MRLPSLDALAPIPAHVIGSVLSRELKVLGSSLQALTPRSNRPSKRTKESDDDY